MVLGKRVAIFDWEWGRNSAPSEGQKIPCPEFKNNPETSRLFPAILGKSPWPKLGKNDRLNIKIGRN